MDYERMWNKLKERIDDSWDDSAWWVELLIDEIEKEDEKYVMCRRSG